MEILTGFVILIVLAIISLIVVDTFMDVQNKKEASPPAEDLESSSPIKY